MRPYTISDGKGTQAVILPEKGATVISLTREGQEFLYRDPENLDSAERPRCGIPFLFPMFGRLKGGVYTWEGKPYAMEIHGFGHTSPWQVAEHTGDSLRCVLEANEDTMAVYPFRFRVELRFRVAEGGLTIGQRFENLGETAMPYHFGFHPYFRVEELDQARVETTAGVCFDYAVGKPEPFGHGSVTVQIPENAPEAGAAFMQVTGPTVLHIPGEGRRVTMEQESYPQLVLWTLAGKPFLCVEPVNGTPDGFNTGAYLTLAPGESREVALKIRPELTE